jgi:hypothetical protein
MITYIPEYVIEPSAGLNGVISPDENITIVCGESQKFAFLPDPGYVVDFFEVDGVVKPKSGNYTFFNVKADHTIHVEFKEAPYFITFTHTGNGEVSPVGREDEIPFGQIGVDDGDMQQFIFVPGLHSVILSVYIDGALVPGAVISGSYVFNNISASHTVHVVFEMENVYIEAGSGPNGTIAPSGTVAVLYGHDQHFDFIPENGYVVDQVFVDNVEAPIGVTFGYYKFENVVEPHTIFVTFKRASYIIEVTACAGGTVNPSGSVSVFHNDIAKFTFHPEEGYLISSVLADGIPYPQCIPEGEYTFYYVTAPHTLDVCFTKITFPISASINGNGFITPAGTTQVPYGTDFTYNFMPAPGFEVIHVFVDGIPNAPAAANGSYTFVNVVAPHTIDVITAPKKYTIAATASAGGFITPSGVVTLNHGDGKIFILTPQNGYEIEKVLVDNVVVAEAAVNGSYAFINVQANHTIHVDYTIKRFVYKGLAYGSGLIDPAGETEVLFGEDITYTITPDNGYEISYVLVNGDYKGAITHYTFFEVDAQGTVEAFFSPLSIKEQTNEIRIFNNLNVIYIVNENHLPITDISIFDVFGRTVYQGSAYTHPITLEVANGIYTVRVATNDSVNATKVSIIR